MPGFQIISTTVRTAIAIAAIVTTGGLLTGIDALSTHNHRLAEASMASHAQLAMEQPVQRVVIVGKRAA